MKSWIGFRLEEGVGIQRRTFPGRLRVDCWGPWFSGLRFPVLWSSLAGCLWDILMVLLVVRMWHSCLAVGLCRHQFLGT